MVTSYCKLGGMDKQAVKTYLESAKKTRIRGSRNSDISTLCGQRPGLKSSTVDWVETFTIVETGTPEREGNIH